MTATFTLDTTAHASIADGLKRAGWLKAQGLSPQQRSTLYYVVQGRPVPVADVVAAIVSGLSANATRFGQSMARRAGRQPLLDLYNLLPSTDVVGDVEQAHRARVEQAQAQEITRLRNRVESDRTTIISQAHQARTDRATIAQTSEQRDSALDTVQAQAEEIRALKRQVAEQVALLQQVPRGTVADVAALGFALDIMTGEQRQRVSDFRTGFRAGRG